MSSVGAVIVNYNAGQHLINAVASLEAEGVTQVVVVDNGSKDGSMTELAKQYPDAVQISLPHNPGYGTAMNRGAHELNTDIVFLLNPDTVVQSQAIKLLTEVLESDDKVGIVGPQLNDSDGTLYPSGRKFPSFIDGVGHALFGLVWKNNPWSKRYKILDWDRSASRHVDWVSGAAMFCRREAFEDIGGFDESYFMYMEDVDLCWRLSKAGWKVAYEPAAEVVHVRGVSTDPTPYRFIVAHHRSLLRYNLRTADGVSRILLPFVMIGLVARIPLACLHRFLAGRHH